MTVCVLALFSLAWQAGPLQRGSGTMGGITYRHETRLVPAQPALRSFGGGSMSEGEWIHRLFYDSGNKVYMGYDLRFEPVDAGRARLIFAPLSKPADQLSPNAEAGNWKPLPVPVMPAAQIVKVGDEVVFDLFVHPQSGQRIVEHLWVDAAAAAAPKLASAPEMSMRDVWMSLGQLRVEVNGRPVELPKPGGVVRGAQVWFAVPASGRYFLSLTARPGFVPAGEVTGRSATFRAGGASISVASEERIIPGEGTFRLYVRHDPTYRGAGTAGAE